MNCRQACDLLSSYIDGELPGAERAQLEQHLATCERCREELAELEAVVDLCRALPEEPVPQDFQRKLHHSLVKRRWVVGWLPYLVSLSAWVARLGRAGHVRGRRGAAGQYEGAPQRRGVRSWEVSPNWMQVATAVCLAIFLVSSVVGVAGIGRGWWAVNIPSERLPLTASGGQGTPPPANVSAAGAPPGYLNGSEVASADDRAGLASTVGWAVAPDAKPRITAGGVVLPAGETVGEHPARQGEMQVTVTDVERAIAEVSRAAEAVGGYLQDSTVTVEGGRRQAVVVARVPVGSLGGVMSGLRSVGSVSSEKVTIRDLTQEWVDADARLRIMRTQEKALGDLMAKARNVDEILRIQYELYRLQADIESLQGRLQYLQDAVDMAALQVVLRESAAVAGPWQRARLAFVGTVHTMERLGQETVVYVAQAFPVVLLAGLAWFVYARFGKGRWPR